MTLTSARPAPVAPEPTPVLGTVTDELFVAPPLRTSSVARGLLRATRPKQWVKQVLVLAAPAAAGTLFHRGVLAWDLLAVLAFTLAAGGTYLVNDANDVQADRRHPTKRHRPLASGQVPLGLGWAAGILLMLGGVGLGAVTGWQLSAVLAIYVTTTLAYSHRLKHVAVVEMVIVASGFVLRALAGGAATHTPLSPWFLLVSSFGAMVIVSGKRYAEARASAEDVTGTRRVLSEYPVGFLKQVRDVSVGATLVSYCLFAVERAGAASTRSWYEISILPVATALLRYNLLVEQGEGEAPEELLLRDSALLIAGLTWILFFALGVAGV